MILLLLFSSDIRKICFFLNFINTKITIYSYVNADTPIIFPKVIIVISLSNSGYYVIRKYI